MKTFTVSAIAFYVFYVLNGQMAPQAAAASGQGACHAAAAGSSAPAACKPGPVAAPAIAAR